MSPSRNYLGWHVTLVENMAFSSRFLSFKNGLLYIFQKTTLNVQRFATWCYKLQIRKTRKVLLTSVVKCTLSLIRLPVLMKFLILLCFLPFILLRGPKKKWPRNCEKLNTAYKLHEYITLNEVLCLFRAQLKLTKHTPSKSAKHGIKVYNTVLDTLYNQQIVLDNQRSTYL